MKGHMLISHVSARYECAKSSTTAIVEG